MSNARNFAVEIDRAFDKMLDEDFLEFKKKVARSGLSGIIEKMPVLTGLAKGNVIVSLGVPNPTTVVTVDPEGSATLQRGLTVINADPNPFLSVFIQDSVPYIAKLEGGSSKQAPLGMFELTANELEVEFL